MAIDKKISELSNGAPAQASDEYVVARGAANYKLTLTNLAASMPPIGATTPNTGAFTTLSATGNVGFDGGTFTFNESGADKDFRVEGDTDANLIFSDASTDRVGIGTSTPATKLDVNGTITATAVNTTTLDLTNLEVTNIKAKDGTAAMSIADSSGIVSVIANPVLSGGTANGVLYLDGSKVATSGSALTFDGTNFATTGTSSAAKLIPTGGTASGNGIYLPAANSIGITTSSANAIRINSSQQTGFGNTAPAYRVHATQTSDGAATTVACLENGGTLASTEARMLFVQGGNTTRGAYVGGVNESASGQPTSMVFGTSAAFATPTERMRITSAGNVGIGTTSPDAKLSVNGVGSFGAGTAALPSVAAFGDLDTGQWFPAANTLAWSTGGSERMRLDSSGNLGLGVTPSAWGSTYKAYQAGVYASFVGDNNNGFVEILNNAYASANNVFRYSDTNSAGRYSMQLGSHKWFTAASGTAGNTVTFTQAMTLDADGDLGIGTTSPASKLHVKVGTNKNLEVRDASAWDGSYSGVFLDSLNDARTSVVDLVARGSNLTLASAGATPMIFNTNATERARITSAGELLVGKTSATSNGGVVQVSNGITFPATQSACSDANTLDDYEEGTWTPSLGGTATYTIQSGTYTKIGRQVTVSCRIQVNAIGTGTTTTFTGLPFTSANADYFGTAYWHTSATALVYLAGGISSTTVTLYGATAATGTLASQVVFQNSTIFVFTATYFV